MQESNTSRVLTLAANWSLALALAASVGYAAYHAGKRRRDAERGPSVVRVSEWWD